MNYLIAPILALAAGSLFATHAFAQDSARCPRPALGTEISQPPDLFSRNGKLNVSLNYFTDVDGAGRTLFCFVTADGLETPTLHVNPGDKISIALTNMVPNPDRGERKAGNGGASEACHATTMSAASVNIHFHGTNTRPSCHGDEVVHTIINPGETFDYVIHIPKDEPPGLYWYHPHVHGISAVAVQGGATGLIEVEGIANIQPIVAGLPERYLVIRDEPLTTSRPRGPNAPFWDISLNYVSVPYPLYPPAIIEMNPGAQEFWRVANTSADTIIDLKLAYDGKAQPLTLVAFDGVPIGSQDGKKQGYTLTQKDVYLPPASRAEFIVTGPSISVRRAVLSTKAINTGPAGDVDPKRPLAVIKASQNKVVLPVAEARAGAGGIPRFSDLATARVTAKRKLYFSEVLGAGNEKGYSQTPQPGGEPGKFYITVEGEYPVLFDPANPPAIVTKEGAVEDWTVENRTNEVHEFHMHQIHFLLLEVNGKPVPRDQQQFYDTYQVGYWKGSGAYPRIKVRMDFRGNIAGDFVYHCHILDHEDLGMMAKIRVLPE